MPAWSLPWTNRTTTRSSQRLGLEKERLLEAREDSLDTADSLTEITLHDEKLARPERRWSRVRVLTVVQYILVVAVAVANIFLIVMIWTGRLKLVHFDQTSLPPEMALNTPQVFTAENKFTINSEDRGVAAWRQQTANIDLGKAYIKDPESHSLFFSELPSDIPGFEMYPVALYHQIHCLGTIREEFYRLNISEEVAYGNHVGHCFDYLRLSLFCAADLTLEYTGHGMDVEHLCKDPKEIDAFMKKYNGDVRAHVEEE